MTDTQVWYIIGIICSSPTHFHSVQFCYLIMISVSQTISISLSFFSSKSACIELDLKEISYLVLESVSTDQFCFELWTLYIKLSANKGQKTLPAIISTWQVAVETFTLRYEEQADCCHGTFFMDIPPGGVETHTGFTLLIWVDISFSFETYKM